MNSLRYKTNDQFWFTIFHEAAHILLHGKKDEFIDDESEGKSDKEKEADLFAANILINNKEYQVFVQPENKPFEILENRLIVLCP